MMRILRVLKNLFLGALCTQGFLLSFIAVGWTQRRMREQTLARWDREVEGTRSGEARPLAWREPVDWIRGAPTAPGWQRWLGGFARNLRAGFAAMANTWAMTIPGCALWLFSWYAGWNNSFHKGYEQAAVGPLTGLLGVALFILAMLYVPMAQARQASVGQWRGFWEFGVVIALIRRRWWGCVRLAALYALLGLPVMILKTAPIAFDRIEGFADVDAAEALGILESYFFWAGMFVFAAYVRVRDAAARLYADALVDSVHAGVVPVDALPVAEARPLEEAALVWVDPEPERHPVAQVARRSTALVWRAAAGSAAVAIWFAFVAQIYVSEFFNQHAVAGWLNQPLVQLPWFKYIPPGLAG